MNTDWLKKSARPINGDWYVDAKFKQDHLTKPPGSLGRLEEVAIKMSALHGCARPSVDNIQIVVFAGDHGIAEENVSAFPQAVTVEMVRNFSAGGAAISVLAKELGADLEVINTGTASEHEELESVIVERVAAATKNFSQQPAMTAEECAQALNIGQQAVIRAKGNHADIFIAGEMGIANTTSATAIACALLGEPAENIVGPGTGLDEDGIKHKAAVINQSLLLHQAQLNTPLEILQTLGGFEIAAITGAYIACAQRGLPILVDGFIASVAALLAIKILPAARQWMLFSHVSAEPGHQKIMQAMKAEPLLDLGMRLGEGSGAAVAVAIIRLACRLHTGMATFSQAGVSAKS